MAAEKRHCQLDGDDLDSVLSHVPTADLLQVTCVSRSWRRSVVATINRRHHRPWLLIHLLNTRRRAGVSAAYDPDTGSWRTLQQPHVTPSPHITFPFLSLALPLQPLASTWPNLPLPRVHRRDAVVSLVGSHLVLAGGVCDLGERTCEVESLSLHPAVSNWKNCRPMPESLRVSAAATWLSVRVNILAHPTASDNSFESNGSNQANWSYRSAVPTTPALINVDNATHTTGIVGPAFFIGRTVESQPSDILAATVKSDFQEVIPTSYDNIN